jgi:hypothetical protein
MLALAMRNRFPGFNWPDLIGLVILVAALCALARWAGSVVLGLLGLAPLGIIAVGVVIRRWRQPRR